MMMSCQGSSQTVVTQFRAQQFHNGVVESHLRLHSLNHIIVESLLGIATDTTEPMNLVKVSDNVALQLMEEQLAAVQKLLGNTPVLFQQAPERLE